MKYHSCFVCGHDNPSEPQPDVSYDETSARTRFDSSGNCEGYQGFIRRGKIAASHDEALAQFT